MLQSKTIKAELADTKMQFFNFVLSQLLSSLVVGELLEMLNGKGFEDQGYADDIDSVVQENGSKTSMNAPLYLSETEGTEKNRENSTLFGKQMKYSKEVKYVGIILDD